MSMEQAAYVIAQSVCAMAEIEAMKAKNKEQELTNMPRVYTEEQFRQVPLDYSLHHNQLLPELFRNPS